jgi:hypothetical protein
MQCCQADDSLSPYKGWSPYRLSSESTSLPAQIRSLIKTLIDSSSIHGDLVSSWKAKEQASMMRKLQLRTNRGFAPAMGVLALCYLTDIRPQERCQLGLHMVLEGARFWTCGSHGTPRCSTLSWKGHGEEPPARHAIHQKGSVPRIQLRRVSAWKGFRSGDAQHAHTP